MCFCHSSGGCQRKGHVRSGVNKTQYTSEAGSHLQHIFGSHPGFLLWIRSWFWFCWPHVRCKEISHSLLNIYHNHGLLDMSFQCFTIKISDLKVFEIRNVNHPKSTHLSIYVDIFTSIHQYKSSKVNSGHVWKTSHLFKEKTRISLPRSRRKRRWWRCWIVWTWPQRCWSRSRSSCRWGKKSWRTSTCMGYIYIYT